MGDLRPGSHPHSALTLRLVLASFGLLVCAGFACWFVWRDLPWAYAVVAAALAAVAAVDIVVIARRKHRGEPG